MKPSTVISLLGGLALCRLGPAQGPPGYSWHLDASVVKISNSVYELPEQPSGVMIFRNGMRVKECSAVMSACDFSVNISQVIFAQGEEPLPDDTLIFDYGTSNLPLAVTQQPQNVTVTTGQNATFGVTASGTAPLNYQWQSSPPGGSGFANIGGATATSYTTPPTQLSDSGTQFLCVVTNPFGVATSSAATLTVRSATPFVTSKTLGFVRNNFAGWVGMQIQVGASPLTVTALGRIVAPGNSRTHTVKIASVTTGQDIPGGSAAVNTTLGSTGNFVYGTLANPVTLNANTAYYVVSQETDKGDQWYDYYNTTLQTKNVATVNSAVRNSGSSYVVVGASAGKSYGPVDFNY
jgi:hypothetical protein